MKIRQSLLALKSFPMAVSEREGLPSAGRGRRSLTAGGGPRLSSRPKSPQLSKSSSRSDQEGKRKGLRRRWFRDIKVVKREKQSDQNASLEGGIHSSVQFYNF